MLQSHISEVDFADNPNFADLTLFPMLSLGHDVRIVAGFLPSYVSRALELLGARNVAGNGNLNIVFCLPAKKVGETNTEAVLRSLLEKSNIAEITAFVDRVRTAQEREVRFSIQFLIPVHGAVITNSAIGLISDRADPSKLVGFLDEFAGDDNSPIHLARTWREDELDIALRFEDLVHAAEKDSWSMVQRVSNIDFAQISALIKTTPTRNSPLIETAQTPTPTAVIPGDPQPSTPAPTQPELDVELDPHDADFDELLSLLELSDGDSEDLIAMFYGDLSRVKDLHDFINNRNRLSGSGRMHAGPANADVAAYIGGAETTCWCGNEYSIREGCPAYYSADE